MRTLLPSLALLGATIAPSARADDLATLKGDWEGFLKINPAVELRILFRIDGAKATMQSPDQIPDKVPVDDPTLEGKELTLTVKANAGVFNGKVDDAGKAIDGQWKQGGQTYPLVLKKTDLADKPAELWEGTLELPNATKLRVVFRLTEREPGTYRATMDSPDQGATAVKVEKAEKKDGGLKFSAPAIQAEYEAKLNAAGDEAVGEFRQGGGILPLTLKKVAKPAEARRSQQPKAPFPYQVEDVRYENRAAGNALAGTFTRPKGDGPFPTVLLITGSGPQDRDESLLGHKPFLVLADDLTRRGIAVLRVDDRGVGGSTGDFAKATSEDFAGDVAAGVAYLKTRKEVDPKAIGLIGHSEGGLIAPMVAAQSPDVAFLVLMAGTGLTGAEILEMQTGLILKASGGSEARVERQREMVRKLAALVREEQDDAVVAEKAKALGKALAETLDEAERKAFGDGDLDAPVKQFTSPWFRYFLAHDPRPTLSQVTCPVLAINGEKDLQVPPKENLAEIAKALKAAGNTRVTTEEFPGLNHLFQACRTGSPSEYAGIEETINPAVLDRIGGWILETTRAKP